MKNSHSGHNNRNSWNTNVIWIGFITMNIGFAVHAHVEGFSDVMSKCYDIAIARGATRSKLKETVTKMRIPVFEKAMQNHPSYTPYTRNYFGKLVSPPNIANITMRAAIVAETAAVNASIATKTAPIVVLTQKIALKQPQQLM